MPPHRGVSKALLNCHLPLIVPKGPGRCEIRVGDQVRGWEEGQLLVLHDTYEHEVWNEASEPRVILFLQVRRPMRWPGRILSNIILGWLRRTEYVQSVQRELGA